MPFIKGYKQSKEHIAKRVASFKGFKQSPEEIERMRERSRLLWKDPSYRAKNKNAHRFKKGAKFTEEHRKNISLALIGKTPSEETRAKMSKIGKRRFGIKEKHPSWLGGKSFEPYGIEFDRHLRKQIRKRDNYRCQECFRHQDELRTRNNKKYKLSVHHVDYDKENNNPNNLISLCMPCHLQTNYSREDWQSYFQNKVKFDAP
jgi:5-methylcytosine-specific restriction endonuclease McrA|tara:strand:- start:114 stop:722 length:609 start_codon:yes stop_codon:yes gene_type:complete